MTSVPKWNVSGDWFDVCKCSIPCPCIFAQAPTYGDCDGILAYHIRKGSYGEKPLDGMNVLFVTYFKGNIWSGQVKVDIAFFYDERADAQQRQALEMIFRGKAGGFMAEFAKLLGTVKGSDFVPIKFEVADDLASWHVQIPGRLAATVEALSGPMTPPGKRVQLYNAPGSEVGPGTVATWGKAVVDEVDVAGFKWQRSGNSSKHIAFSWSGP
jgi:hypothetical protein